MAFTPDTLIAEFRTCHVTSIPIRRPVPIATSALVQPELRRTMQYT